jgi:hypothetical protein
LAGFERRQKKGEVKGLTMLVFLQRGNERPLLSLVEMGKISRVFLESLGFLSLFFYLSLVNFLPPLSIWLEVHLYRKSLHVLFKKILQ